MSKSNAPTATERVAAARLILDNLVYKAGGCIKIDDLRPGAIRAMLRYIYSAKLEEIAEPKERISFYGELL